MIKTAIKLAFIPFLIHHCASGLGDAVKSENLSRVKAVLNSSDCNMLETIAYDGCHFSVLGYCIRTGKSDEMVEALLQHKDAYLIINKWLYESWDCTPLMCATWDTDSIGHLKLLIAYNADLEVKDSDGDTAFQWAVIHKNLPAIEALLDAGATTSGIRDYDGILHAILKKRNNNQVALYNQNQNGGAGQGFFGEITRLSQNPDAATLVYNSNDTKAVITTTNEEFKHTIEQFAQFAVMSQQRTAIQYNNNNGND